jgi:hypothetical protein
MPLDPETAQTIGRLSQAVETLTETQRENTAKLDKISTTLAEQAGERRASRRISALTATVVSLIVSFAGLLLKAIKGD